MQGTTSHPNFIHRYLLLASLYLCHTRPLVLLVLLARVAANTTLLHATNKIPHGAAPAHEATDPAPGGHSEAGEEDSLEGTIRVGGDDDGERGSGADEQEADDEGGPASSTSANDHKPEEGNVEEVAVARDVAQLAREDNEWEHECHRQHVGVVQQLPPCARLILTVTIQPHAVVRVAADEVACQNAVP